MTAYKHCLCICFLNACNNLIVFFGKENVQLAVCLMPNTSLLFSFHSRNGIVHSLFIRALVCNVVKFYFLRCLYSLAPIVVQNTM